MKTKPPSPQSNGAQLLLRSDKREQPQFSDHGHIREILNDLGDSAWSHDLRTNTTWFSSENNPFIGHIPHALASDKSSSIWTQSMHPEDRHLLEESKAAYNKGKQLRHSLEYRVIDPNGKIRWVLDRGVAVEKSKDGRPLLIVGIHVDITEVRQLHNRLDMLLQQKNKEILRAVIERNEEDKKEIAIVLRENVNQMLTAGRMMLEFLPVMDKAVGDFTEKIKEIMYSAVDEVNKICSDINPDALNHISLTDLVKDLVNRLNKTNKVVIGFDHHLYLSSTSKNKEQELAILRVIQGCLFTLMHESASSTISIQLESNNDRILLELSCNDKKLRLKKFTANPRIHNLANRCALLDGEFHFEKAKNEGVLIKASIPV